MYANSPSQGFGFGRSQSPFDDDFFSLGAPVGPGQPNRREDVIKVETILGNTGHHDLAKTDGQLGWWGDRQEKAVKAWQGGNGLKVDGLLKPNGPTITSLKQAAGGLLGRFKPPTPDEVDEHHGRLAQGELGLLNTRPARLSIRVPEKVPELDEQTLAFNADTARALTRTSVDGDVPNIYANYLNQAGSDGHTTVLDLVEQVKNTQGRDRAERVLHGILGQVAPDQAKAFLGGEMPAQRPIGVRMADLADDDAVPLFAQAPAAEAPKPVQLAQADTGTMTDAVPASAVPATPSTASVNQERSSAPTAEHGNSQGANSQSSEPSISTNSPQGVGSNQGGSSNQSRSSEGGVESKKGEIAVDKVTDAINNSAKPGPTGKCATHVRKALEAGGVDTSGHPVDAKDYGPTLKKNGFEAVGGDDYKPQKGDVVVIQPYEGGNPSGHIAIFNGTEWVSDTKQRDMWGGPGYRKHQPPHVVYRRN